MTKEVDLGGFYHNTHAIYHMMVDYTPVYKNLEPEEYRNFRWEDISYNSGFDV